MLYIYGLHKCNVVKHATPSENYYFHSHPTSKFGDSNRQHHLFFPSLNKHISVHWLPYTIGVSLVPMAATIDSSVSVSVYLANSLCP